MKTSTAVLLGVGVVTVGGLVYLFFFRRNGIPVLAGPTQVGSAVDPGLLTQPSQLYPVQPPSPTRQDTASQPWYGGARPADASSNIVDQNMLKNAQTIAGAAGIVSSVKSIWDDLDISSWWSSTDSSVQEDDMFAGSNFSWNSYLGVF